MRCPPLQVWLVSPPSPATDALAASLGGFRALRVRVVAPAELETERPSPRIVLLDRSLGDAAVLDAARVVRERYPDLPVVVLDNLDDPGSTARAMLRTGAYGCADPRWGVDHVAREILAALAWQPAGVRR